MSTTRSGPIWTQPAPGTRKPRFTREQIAEIALRIADREGFEALSMRRIADELDAGTMTLYHYVRTKEDLMQLMDDAIMAEVLVAPELLTRDWVASIAAIARSSYRAFQRHPWVLVALKGARFGPNSMRHVEQSMAAVAHAPFDLQAKLDIIGIVDDYVFGYVYRNAEIKQYSEFASGTPSQALIEFTRAQFATGEYPQLEALVGDDIGGAWARISRQMNHEARFERGLMALLEGLRHTLGSGPAPRATARASSGGRKVRPRARRKS